MDLPEIIRAIISPIPEKTGFKSHSLNPGDILKGTILGVRKGGKTLVDFGSFRVFAEIKFPIDAGAVLRVRVLESGEQLTLKVIDLDSRLSESHINNRGHSQPSTAQSISKFRSALMNVLQQNESLSTEKKLPSNIKDALIVIRSYFEPFGLEGEVIKLAARLKSQVQASGIFYEKLLENILTQTDSERPAQKTVLNASLNSLVRADIKPNLHILKDFFNRPAMALTYFDKNDVDIIRNLVSTLFADVVDQQQKAPIVPHDSDQTLFFTTILNLKDSDKLSKLRVYCAPKKKDDSSGPTRISLLLNMDKMGEIRSDISLFNQEIHVNFFVLNQDIKHRIEENLSELKRPLTGLFKNLVLRVAVSESKITDFTQKEMRRVTNTKVDIRV